MKNFFFFSSSFLSFFFILDCFVFCLSTFNSNISTHYNGSSKIVERISLVMMTTIYIKLKITMRIYKVFLHFLTNLFFALSFFCLVILSSFLDNSPSFLWVLICTRKSNQAIFHTHIYIHQPNRQNGWYFLVHF